MLWLYFGIYVGYVSLFVCITYVFWTLNHESGIKKWKQVQGQPGSKLKSAYKSLHIVHISMLYLEKKIGSVDQGQGDKDKYIDMKFFCKI